MSLNSIEILLMFLHIMTLFLLCLIIVQLCKYSCFYSKQFNAKLLVIAQAAFLIGSCFAISEHLIHHWVPKRYTVFTMFYGTFLPLGLLFSAIALTPKYEHKKNVSIMIDLAMIIAFIPIPFVVFLMKNFLYPGSLMLIFSFVFSYRMYVVFKRKLVFLYVILGAVVGLSDVPAIKGEVLFHLIQIISTICFNFVLYYILILEQQKKT